MRGLARRSAEPTFQQGFRYGYGGLGCRSHGLRQRGLPLHLHHVAGGNNGYTFWCDPAERICCYRNRSPIQHWVDNLAIGPWYYVPSVRPKEFVYQGKPSIPEISIALAFSGSLRIELIQPVDDTTSAYRDFLRSGQQGLQHVSSWPDD